MLASQVDVKTFAKICLDKRGKQSFQQRPHFSSESKTLGSGSCPQHTRKHVVLAGAGRKLTDKKLEVAFSFLSTILGRSFAETKSAYERLADEPDKNSGLFEVVYGLGTLTLPQSSSKWSSPSFEALP